MASHPIVEAGFHEAQGRRDTMEDTHAVFENLKTQVNSVPEHTSFFAVYDGHGGTDTALLLQERLHLVITSQSEFKSGDIPGALNAGFQEADQLIVEESNAGEWTNGSTGVVGLLVGRKLCIANVGDSEAVLVNVLGDDQVTVKVLTTLHRACDPQERKRIETLGGHVFFNRLFGSLAVSRSFGDSRFKIPKTSQNFVSCEPSICQVELTNEDKYLVLACDGLWDVISHDEAARIIHSAYRKGQSPKEIAAVLVNEAILKKTEDNVTVLVVVFEWGDNELDVESERPCVLEENEGGYVNEAEDGAAPIGQVEHEATN